MYVYMQGLAEMREVREAGGKLQTGACTLLLEACCNIALGEGVLRKGLDLIKVIVYIMYGHG